MGIYTAILIWIGTLLTLAVGYLLGKGIDGPGIQGKLHSLISNKHINVKQPRRGAIETPTQQDIEDKENPEAKEGKEAVKQFLDSRPELQK